MAVTDFLLIDPELLNSARVSRIRGNGLKNAIEGGDDPNVVLPRGRFLAVKVSDLNDVILVDEGANAPIPQVFEVPAPRVDEVPAAESESPAAQPDPSETRAPDQPA